MLCWRHLKISISAHINRHNLTVLPSPYHDDTKSSVNTLQSRDKYTVQAHAQLVNWSLCSIRLPVIVRQTIFSSSSVKAPCVSCAYALFHGITLKRSLRLFPRMMTFTSITTFSPLHYMFTSKLASFPVRTPTSIYPPDKPMNGTCRTDTAAS